MYSPCLDLEMPAAVLSVLRALARGKGGRCDATPEWVEERIERFGDIRDGVVRSRRALLAQHGAENLRRWGAPWVDNLEY